jgi:Protein of unknown function (DUF2587)
MSTDTSRGTFDQPAVTGANPNRPPDKVMRIAAMTKQLLDEVRAQRLDAPGVEWLRAIDTQTIRELQTIFRKDRGYPVFRRVGRRPTILRRMLSVKTDPARGV